MSPLFQPDEPIRIPEPDPDGLITGHVTVKAAAASSEMHLLAGHTYLSNKTGSCRAWQ